MSTTVLPAITPSDFLGRGIFQSNQARSIIPTTVFREKINVDRLSVDRLDLASNAEMAEIADRVAAGRGPSRNFYGWAVVSVAVAERDGRTVEATPLLDDPYHADIVLNLPVDADRTDAAIQHAQSLARHAHFRSRP